MERLRTLQAALTNAQTAAAFEKIAEVAFPKAQLEGYQDALAEAQLTYEAIAASSAEAFNPERSALAVQSQVQITRSATELAQITEGINNRENLSIAEKKRLIDQTTKAQKDYVASVREAENIQGVTLAIKQAGDYLKTLQDNTRATYEEVESLKLRNKLQLEGLSPQRIEAELNKARIDKETAIQLANINAALDLQLAKRAELEALIAAAAPKDKAELQRQLLEALNTIKILQAQLAALPGGAAGGQGRRGRQS
jgi:hypothetical protein